MIDAVPADAGVKTPALVTLPIVEGFTDHATVLLKLPVPVTTDEQVAVWFMRIAAEEQDGVTVAMVDSGVITFGPNRQPVKKMSGRNSEIRNVFGTAHETLQRSRAESQVTRIRLPNWAEAA